MIPDKKKDSIPQKVTGLVKTDVASRKFYPARKEMLFIPCEIDMQIPQYLFNMILAMNGKICFSVPTVFETSRIEKQICPFVFGRSYGSTNGF